MRGAATRSSEREATWSREGQEVVVVVLLVALGDGDVVREVPLMLKVCMVPVMLGIALELLFWVPVSMLLLVLAADFLSV